MKTFFQKKNKSKRSSLDTCWRKTPFCSEDVTKTGSENRERGTWNRERGTGNRERGTWNGKTISKNKTENWKGSY